MPPGSFRIRPQKPDPKFQPQIVCATLCHPIFSMVDRLVIEVARTTGRLVNSRMGPAVPLNRVGRKKTGNVILSMPSPTSVHTRRTMTSAPRRSAVRLCGQSFVSHWTGTDLPRRIRKHCTAITLSTFVCSVQVNVQPELMCLPQGSTDWRSGTDYCSGLGPMRMPF